MEISNRTNNQYQIFDIKGNIAFEETQEMEDYIYTNISIDKNKTIINLKEVPYLNSSALGAFVRILQTLKNRKMDLFIMNINSDIDNLFKITGVNKYFNFIKESDIN
ncbi:MAG: STAS domain-containing protein [Spirochaetes bacterium]|nr:STAS domain-containing protein [Spirochaetota bacterium]MBN2769661.1 STAS domain-containing protein [Spirochaetota bacterium]